MSGVSFYFCNLVADNISNRSEFPDTVYIALTTQEPFAYSSGSSIAEPPAGVGYSRQSYSMTSGNWTQASNGACRNVNQIVFTTNATGLWGNIVAWVACTASSGGEILFWGTLDSNVYVNTGAYVSIPADGMEYSVEPPSTAVIG